jgi:hypothetical protein
MPELDLIPDPKLLQIDRNMTRLQEWANALVEEIDGGGP